jgi:hypothetical protein
LYEAAAARRLLAQASLTWFDLCTDHLLPTGIHPLNGQTSLAVRRLQSNRARYPGNDIGILGAALA